MSNKYKIYKLPEIVKQKKTYTMVAFYPKYSEKHLIVHDNECGLIPLPLDPVLEKRHSDFNPNGYSMSDYKRRQWQKLSGIRAYIYALLSNNEVFYIGSTTNTYRRLKQHRRNISFQIRMVVLCECPKEFQFDEEKRWILGAAKIGLKNIRHNSN